MGPARLVSLLLAITPLLLPGAGVATAPEAEHAFDVAALAKSGPCAVEAVEVLVDRRGDEDGDFRARLYIPVGSRSTPCAASTPGSPIVAFGHGYLAPVDLYETTLQHLASWGITVIAPRSGGELLPSHERFAADLVTAIDWVAHESAGGADWPGLLVDETARGVSGHSMGGGVAVLAAAMDPRIHAVATLAAADARPSAIEAAGSVTAPALFIAAGEDAITPVDQHQQRMFDAKSTGATRLHIIEGGSHCGFLDAEILVGLVCDEASIDVAEQRAQARIALVAWFRAVLLDDVRMADVAWPTRSGHGTGVETEGDQAPLQLDATMGHQVVPGGATIASHRSCLLMRVG